MIEKISKCERQISLQKNSNNLYGYSSLGVWAGLSDLFPKNRAWKVLERDFTVEKPGKHHLSQVTEVNISSVSHGDSIYFMMWCNRNFSSTAFCLQTPV